MENRDELKILWVNGESCKISWLSHVSFFNSHNLRFDRMRLC